jgi:hypothetical protein
MSTWALVVMVLLVLLAAAIVGVAVRRGDRSGTPRPEPGRPAGRTVGDLVRDRSAGPPSEPEPAEPAAPAGDATTAEARPAPATAAADEPAEPPAERRAVAEEVDAGPVGPPWTRGFVDGVPVEAPPRTRPQRRSTVDPALVARVTSVAPPTPAREDRPMARGIVSPAVAEAVARAEASRRQAPETPSDETAVPAPRAGAGRRPVLGVVRGWADEEREVRRLRAVPPLAAVAGGAAIVALAQPAVVAREAEKVAEVAEVAEQPAADVEQRPVEVADEPVGKTSDAGAEPVEEAVDAQDLVAGQEEGEPAPEPCPHPDSGTDTPAAQAGHPPVTLSPVSPTTSAPEPAPMPAGTATDETRAAEHAAVDLALLRTLGFADPNPRPGTAPVVDLAVPHEDEEPLAPGQAVPVRFLVVQRDRLPVADAVVTLLDPRGRQTASASADVAGRGEITAPRPGGYVLVAAADGHQPGVVALTVPDTEYAVAEVEVQLVRSSTVAGAVRETGGSGVAEVAVSLLQDGELVATTITAADGGYRFGELAAGEYTIAVAREGRELRAVPVRVGEEADAAQDVVLAGPLAQPSGAEY